MVFPVVLRSMSIGGPGKPFSRRGRCEGPGCSNCVPKTVFPSARPIGSYGSAAWDRLQAMSGPDAQKATCCGTPEVAVWRIAGNLRQDYKRFAGRKRIDLYSAGVLFIGRMRVGRVVG